MDFVSTSNVSYRGLAGIQLVLLPINLSWVGGSSNWSNAGNWDLGILPTSISTVSIDPTASLTVTGPTSQTEITSLLVDSQNAGSNATLDVQSAGALTVSGVTTIGTRGRIAGSGILIATGGVSNSGELDLAAGLRLAGGTLTNNGTLFGDGQVDNVLANGTSGEVRVAASERLKFTDTGAHSNAGRIEAIGSAVQGQAELEITGPLTNAVSTGLITGRNAILRFTSGLTNNGSLALSFGTSDVFGDVNNSATGVIAVAGNSQATFYDDVANSGVLNVVTGSTVVIIGALTGNGNMGGGDVQALDVLAPGASPGLMDFGGDLLLGPLSTLEAEFGGTAPGSQFDQVNVAGVANLEGTLNVTTIDLGGGDFVPALGNSFDVLTAGGGIVGTFDAENLLALDPGLFWDVDYGATVLTLNIVDFILGDMTGDGLVNLDDVPVFIQALVDRAAYDATYPLVNEESAGDIDGSDTFDLGDLAAFSGLFTPASAASIPEPSTLTLAAFALLGLAYARRRS